MMEMTTDDGSNRQTQVMDRVERLESQLKILDEAISTLEEDLVSVLRKPVPPVTAGKPIDSDKKGEQTLVPLAQMLSEMVDVVQAAVVKVNDIRNRLEV